MITLLLTVILTAGAAAPAHDYAARIAADETLAVPGVGAERVLLGDPVALIRARLGVPEAKAAHDSRRELFRDVLRVAAPVSVFFTTAYHYRSRRCVVLADADRAVAVIGQRTDRITPESVQLGRGVEYFIFTYGNAAIRAVTKEGNTLYLYPELGIGIVDDKNDDAIDMFIVFPPRGH